MQSCRFQSESDLFAGWQYDNGSFSYQIEIAAPIRSAMFWFILFQRDAVPGGKDDFLDMALRFRFDP